MIDVAVLGGGASREHDVSLRSATEVADNLDRERWRVWGVHIDARGRWHLPAGPSIPGEWRPGDGPPRDGGESPGRALCRLIDEHHVRVIYPALHGRHGEDGTLQGMLDLHEIAYVGSGTAASAVAMDKIRSRECLTAHGVPMAPAYVPDCQVDERDPEGEAERIGAAVGFPCFLKIDLSGSSYGVARADGPRDVVRFLRTERGCRYLAEASLVGEEISVPVLGNREGTLRPLTPIGIYPLQDRFFDVRAKYEPGRTEELAPPRGLDADRIAEVQRLALRCHLAIGCDGVSRTDMIVTEDGPKVLELNTLPGMTRQSLLPKAAAAEGVDFSALLDELLRLALERHSAVVDHEP